MSVHLRVERCHQERVHCFFFMAPPPPANEGTVGETVPDPVQTEVAQAEFAALIAAAAPGSTTGTPDRTGAVGATGATTTLPRSARGSSASARPRRR